MHTFYAVADVGSGKTVIKLYVEEMFDPNAADSKNRAYQIQNMKIQQAGVTGSQNISASRITNPAAIKTIADLFDFVKVNDNEFNPHSVHPAMLNADGTPKHFYHGTGRGDRVGTSFLPERATMCK